MTEDIKPERLWIRTEDGIHHITGWGKLSTGFNPTTAQEYIRRDLADHQLAELKEKLRQVVQAHGTRGIELEEQRKELERVYQTNADLNKMASDQVYEIAELKKEIEELRKQVDELNATLRRTAKSF